MSEELAGATEVAPTPVTVVDAPEPSIEDTMGAVFDKMNSTDRDEGGRFKAKEAAPTQAAPKESEKGAVAEGVEPAQPAIDIPQSYSADLKDWWSTIPRERQEFLSKREMEATKKIQELGETAKETERYRELSARHQHALEGAPLDQVIENLLATKSAFLRDPRGTYIQLGKQLGIDPSQLAPQQQQFQPTGNEHFDMIQRQLQEVMQVNANLQNQLNQHTQTQEQNRVRTVESIISKFAEGKEDHWSKIEPTIFRQVTSVRAANPHLDEASVLKQAYEEALVLTGTKQELEKAANEKAEKDKALEAKKKADEAKRLASLNVRSNAGRSPKSAPNKDMYAEMGDVYDRLNATG